jgi:hypothetical protein
LKLDHLLYVSGSNYSFKTTLSQKGKIPAFLNPFSIKFGLMFFFQIFNIMDGNADCGNFLA